MKLSIKPQLVVPPALSRSGRLGRQRKPLLALFLLLLAGLSQAQTSSQWLTNGLNYLAAQDLADANTCFSNALALTPTDPTANVGFAATRLLVLPNTPDGSNLLNRLDLAATNRSIYDWTARPPEDTNGVPLAPTNLSAAELTAFIYTNVLSQIMGAATNLGNVSATNYTLSVSSNETVGAAVTMDYGDLLLLHSGLVAAESAIYTIDSVNVDAQLAQVRSLLTRGETFQDLLAQYTNLLTWASISNLPAASQALSNAIVLYFQASAFIRNRPTNVVRLFNYDTNMATDEANFRTTLSNILASLSGPAVLALQTNVTIDLANFFSGAHSLRSFLPIFEGNKFLDGTLPDVTFGGVLAGLTSYQIESRVNKLVDYEPDPYVFTTIAGVVPGSADGVGSSARFNNPTGISRDQNGNLYIADANNNTIRKLTYNGAQWVSTTIAGTAGVSGSADDSNGAIQFNNPNGVAVDAHQNVYVADTGNATIRKLTLVGTNWVSSTIAGTADVFGSADGTNGTVQFISPNGLALDGNANLYVTDGPKAGEVRRLKPQGTNWVSSTIATGLSGVAGIAVDANQNVFVSQLYYGSAITVLSPVGNTWVATNLPLASSLNGPYGLAVDTNDNLYVANYNGDTISFITPQVTAVSNGFVTNWVVALTVGQSGTSGSADGMYGAPLFNRPAGVALWPGQALFVTDAGNCTVRELAGAGTNVVTSTIAGLPSSGSEDGTNASVQFDNPGGVARDSAGNFYVADTGNSTIRKLSQVGGAWVSSTIAGTAGNAGYDDGINGDIQFVNPQDVAADNQGNLYVSDAGNSTIRKLSLVGGNWYSSTIAGSAYGSGFADGIGTNALFNSPQSIAVDSSGSSIYVADTYNSVIRRLTQQGANWVTKTIGTNFVYYYTNYYNGTNYSIYTNYYGGYSDGTNDQISFSQPQGVAVDNAGNVYVADSGNTVIRKLIQAGVNWVSSTIAGSAYSYGSADGTSKARFDNPAGVGADASGNVYVADEYNNTIRKLKLVGTNWVVTTIGGQAGNYGFASGTNSAALFNNPLGLAVDNSGNVYVADSSNNAIRQGLLEGESGVGVLQVVLGPAGAVSAGAQWQVDSNGVWYSSGVMVSNLTAGTHTISFSTVSDWTTPASTNVSIVANQTATATGTYTISSSAIAVTIQTVPTGLTVTVDGTNLLAPQTLAWMPGAQHTLATTNQKGAAGIEYVWAGWSDAGAISHTVTSSASVTNYTANFTTNYYLTTTAVGNGSVNPVSGWYQVGADVLITAVPAAGNGLTAWAGTGAGSYSGINNPALITMDGPITESGTFASATFTASKGVYIGLFYDITKGVAQDSSGAFTVSTTAKGAFSGSLQIGGTKYTFSGGHFDTNGYAVATAKSSKGSLTVDLQIDLTTGSDRITGTVEGGTWVSQLSGDLEVNDGSPSFAGKHYTFAIAGSTNSAAAPGGDGFGTLTISSAGKVKLGGTLADGTKISQSSSLSKYGQCPIYVSLYGGQGSILSWITFSNEPAQDLSSDLVSWSKPAGGKNYTEGFTLETTLTGSLYASGTALSFTDGELILQGGGLDEPLTNQVLLSNNKVSLSGGKKPILSFAASSGLFSGSLTLSNNTKMSLGGVALQQTNLATGSFQNNGLSGQVLLTPASSHP